MTTQEDLSAAEDAGIGLTLARIDRRTKTIINELEYMREAIRRQGEQTGLHAAQLTLLRDECQDLRRALDALRSDHDALRGAFDVRTRSSVSDADTALTAAAINAHLASLKGDIAALRKQQATQRAEAADLDAALASARRRTRIIERSAFALVLVVIQALASWAFRPAPAVPGPAAPSSEVSK